MSDRDALLAAITAEPDDDTPRLVYADWLDEHGEGERAEFIRAQCRLEHVSPRSEEAKQLNARVAELHAKLFGHLSRLAFADIAFRRGFVGTVRSGLLTFRDNLKHLRSEDAPAFGWVYRSDVRDEAEFEKDPYDPHEAQTEAAAVVFDYHELRRCVSLDLPGGDTSPGRAVCESKRLVNLRRLNFPGNETGPHIESIASPTFANLRWANFNDSNSANGRPSIVPLAECPHLANLEYLDFGSNALCDEDAETVSMASQWVKLKFLCLSSGWFTPDGIASLFNTPNLPALAELDLSASFSEERLDEYAVSISDFPLLAQLSKLWLCRNEITDAGTAILAKYPRDVKLTLLDLSGNPIGAAGKRVLRKRFGEGVCVFGEDTE